MAGDSPAVVVFGTDGYEVSVRDNTVLENNGDIKGLLIAGSDGQKSHHILTDNQGRLVLSSTVVDGYSIIAGQDANGTTHVIKTLDNGVLQNRYYELSTFNAIVSSVPTAQNKSLMSLLNSSNKTVRIEEIYLVNVRTVGATGVTGVFELKRITGHSSGNLVSNVESYETTDVLDSGITIRSSAVVSGESTNILWRSVFSTNEHGVNALDTESAEHIFQTMFPVFVKKTNNSKTITLKSNEGLNIKFITNSATGIFDVFCVFTQE